MRQHHRRYNAAMRSGLLQFVLAAWLLTFLLFSYAWSQNPNDSSQRTARCQSKPHGEPLSDPEISISDVTFSGFIQMPISEQDAIADAVKRETYGSNVEGVVEEALERIKAGWQDRGYFKVEVSGDAKTTAKDASNPKIALFAHVDENAQYKLGAITFRNNRAISSARLRDLLLIEDGGFFSRQKIALGLENLHKVYGEFGYINYTGVPLTTFDEEKELVYLEIDVDEGKQFIVSDIKVEGLDVPARRRVSKNLALKPGGVYNSRLWELSLSRITSMFPGCECNPSSTFHLDEQMVTVEITLDLHPCVTN